jgi:hypothetical protein
MSTTPDWLLIVTGLGAGVVGSVITTYGTQTRERRQARAQSREAIRQVQNLIVSPPTYEQLTAALDNLETSAMLAGLPKNLTGLNREALYILRELTAPDAQPPPDDVETANVISDAAFAADHIAAETVQLLTDATWHPVLSAPRQWYRTRQLSRLMDIRPGRLGFNPRVQRRGKRRWERETIRKARRQQNERNAAGRGSAGTSGSSEE